jgi:hypothetical protein
MKSLVTLVLSLSLMTLGSLGCRKAHLGSDTGDAYRAAFHAQAESTGKSPKLDAHDAKQAVRVHRYGSRGGPSAPLSSPMPSTVTMSGGLSGSSSGSDYSNSGGSSSAAASDGAIRLRAK